jgi:plastocyanin
MFPHTRPAHAGTHEVTPMPARPIPTLALAVGLLLSAVLLAACSGSGTASAGASVAASAAAPSVATSQAPASTAPSASASGAAGGSAVSVKNFAFAPPSLSVAVGTTVTWTNEDTTAHTVTADDGTFDSKNIASGATFTQTFDTAGSFAYHCTLHPNMTATIEVK